MSRKPEPIPFRSKRKRFLFDLDETLYMGDLVSVASCQLIREKKLDKLYTGKDITKFPDMDGVPNIVKERTFELFSDPVWGAIEKTPVPGAYNFLYLLACKYIEIGVLTARPQCIRKATEFALWRDFPEINIKVLFANSGDTGCKGVSKKELLKEFDPHVYFDDHYDYCKEAIEVCPNAEVHLISNTHTRWNREYECEQRIRKIKSINDYDTRNL